MFNQHIADRTNWQRMLKGRARIDDWMQGTSCSAVSGLNLTTKHADRRERALTLLEEATRALYESCSRVSTLLYAGLGSASKTGGQGPGFLLSQE